MHKTMKHVTLNRMRNGKETEAYTFGIISFCVSISNSIGIIHVIHIVYKTNEKTTPN